MGWKMYEVTFELLSPLHIGERKLGNLQKTRYYVPGRTLWGALTARIARDYENFDYKKAGEKVEEFLRFSYFFPSNDTEKVTLFPWENPDEFEWKYIQSYVTTALDPKVRKAEYGSLHETEYIAPKTREDEKVYLIGYIFERDDCDLNWKEALSKILLGGERTYGWGRIGKLQIGCKKTNQLDHFMHGKASSTEPTGSDKYIYEVELSNETPVIRVHESCPVVAHVLVDDQINNDAKNGNIEPLIGLETNIENGSFGSKISAAKICWTPGTMFKKTYSFLICPKGFWKFKKSNLFKADCM